jgi:hypothetical protein
MLLPFSTESRQLKAVTLSQISAVKLTIVGIFGEERTKDGTFCRTGRLRVVNGIDEGGDTECIGEEDEF